MLPRHPAAITAIIAAWLVCGLTGARAPAQEPASGRLRELCLDAILFVK